MNVLANLLRGFGPISTSSTPATPALAVADNGNGTGATATITGSTPGSTNTVFAAPIAYSGDLSWTNCGSRSGDGTLSLAIADGRYIGRVDSTLSGLPDAPGNFPVFAVTGGAGRSNRIEYALVGWLNTKGYLTSLVGSRIQPPPLAAPPALPAVTYQRISAVRAGDTRGSAGLEMVRIRFTSWGALPEDAGDVAEALRNALDGLVGRTLTWANGSFYVQSAFLEGDRDVGMEAASPELSAQRLYGVQADLKIAYSQTIPSH